MNNFKLIDMHFATMPLLAQLKDHAYLWSQYPIRTAGNHSPHRECDDILVHFEFDKTGDFRFYPAIERLPAVFDLCKGLLVAIEPDEDRRAVTEFGRIVITRMPMQAVIYKHTDMPEHTDLWKRYHMCITGSALFHCGDEMLEESPGMCFWFDNSKPHWVRNNGSIRIHLIVDVKK